MRPLFVLGVTSLALLCGAPSHPSAAQNSTPGKKAEAPPANAQAIRKALDQKITLDYLGQSIQEALQHLQQKTGVNFVVDTFAIQQNGVFFPEVAIGIGPGGAIGGFPGGIPGVPGQPGQPQIALKSEGGKVSQALRGLLAPMNLTYVVVRDSVIVTTEEMAPHRQLRQRVAVDVKDVPLRGALEQIANETGVTLVFDPAVGKSTDKGVTLQLDDTSLETAVRLLTEMSGVKSVPIGNVMFITTEERGSELRREINETQRPTVPPLTNPGFPAIFRGGMFNGNVGGGIPPIEAQPPRPDPAVPPLPPPLPKKDDGGN